MSFLILSILFLSSSLSKRFIIFNSIWLGNNKSIVVLMYIFRSLTLFIQHLRKKVVRVQLYRVGVGVGGRCPPHRGLQMKAPTWIEGCEVVLVFVHVVLVVLQRPRLLLLPCSPGVGGVEVGVSPPLTQVVGICGTSLPCVSVS